MSEFPPPSGPPVAFALSSDPWAEQARRRERHRAERRRRRRRVLAAAVAVGVSVTAAGVGAFFAVGPGGSGGSRGSGGSGNSATGSAQPDIGTGDDDVDASAPSTAVIPNSNSSNGSAASDKSTDDDGEQAAEVIDVWLLDRADGNFEWGAVLSSSADVVRGDLDVSIVVVDDEGNQIFADQVTVPRLAPGRTAAVGGGFDVDAGKPARVEVTATLGSALPDEAGAVFVVSDVRRIASGQVDRDDRLLGTVELLSGSRTPVRLAALWRDDDDRVIAAVFDVLDPVDIEAAVDFSLRLPRNFVPPGAPDTIVANVGATD